MNIITKIGEFCKSVGGIISFGVVIISGASSWLFIHNANVKTKFAVEYVKQGKSITKHDVDSIVILRIIPIMNRLDNISDSLNTNYKKTNQLTNNYVLFAKKNSATVDDFVNAVNGLEVVVVKSSDKSTDDLNFKMIIQKKKNGH